MTQKNPYLINDKLPETATVSYYDVETDQNLTQEEWNKLNFLNQEDIAISPDSCRIYISEKAYNKGIAMYGPGFWDDFGLPVTKFVTKAVISGAAAGSIIASGGATAPLLLYTGAVTYGTGKFVSSVSKESGWKTAEWIGDVVSDTGSGVFTGALVGPAGQSFKSLATHIGEGVETSAKLVKEFHDMYSRWEDVKNIRAVDFHVKHLAVGIKRHSWCDVCN